MIQRLLISTFILFSFSSVAFAQRHPEGAARIVGMILETLPFILLIFIVLAIVKIVNNKKYPASENTINEINFDESFVDVIPEQSRTRNRDDQSNTQYMRLMFKRSQTSKTPPTFTLHIALELPEGVAAAARHYGVYKDIVYLDPKLANARALRAKQASQQYKDVQLQYDMVKSGAFSDKLRTDLAVNLFVNALKWSVLLPFYIVWRIFKWIISERKQTIRLHQLPQGKTISSKNLAELFDAENQITESLNIIAKFIKASSNYNGREVLIIPEEKA